MDPRGGAASSRMLETGEHRIHYHDVGAGPPLLLLPAFGPLPGTTAWLTYERALHRLTAAHRCILVDYPNFGRSSPVEFHEPVHDVYVRHAIAVLDALGLDAVGVVGVSTGGTVALDLALAAPARVTRMVVGSCEASTGGDPCLFSPFPSEVFRLFQDCLGHAPDRDRIRRLLTAIVFDEGLVSESLVETMYRWRVDEPDHADAWQRSTSTPHSNLGAVGAIAVPTLIVHGSDDRMVPLESALRLARHLPTADVVVLGRCGHWPPVERPCEFAHHAAAFLEES